MPIRSKFHEFTTPIKDRIKVALYREGESTQADQAVPTSPPPSSYLPGLPLSLLGSPSLLDPPAPASDSATESESEPDPWTELKRLSRLIDRYDSPAKTVVDGLIEYIELYESAAEGQTEFDSLRCELEDTFKYIRKRTTQKAWKGTNSTRNICRSILEELGRLPGKQHSSVAQATIDTGSNAEVLACYQRIRSLVKRLSLDLDTPKGTWDTFTIGFAAKNLAPSLSALYNSAETAIIRGPCAPGTQVDTLAKILSWIDTSTIETIYWATGTVGTGKTTIAYSLCKELESRFTLAASFFCSQFLPNCHDITRVIPSIAYQLAQFSRPYRLALDRVILCSESIHSRSLEQQFQLLVTKPFHEVFRALPENLVIIIDGLEACKDQELALRLLQSIVQVELPVNVKFVIFTQFKPEVQGFQEGSDATILPRVTLHNLDNRAGPSDIEAYLGTTLAPISPLPSKVTSLAERAGNSFYYAVTVARYLNPDELLGDPLEELDALLSALSPSLPSLHEKIDELYSVILQRTFERSNLKAEVVVITRHILNTLACFREALTSKAITSLLKTDHNRMLLALSLLRSVISFSKNHHLAVSLHPPFASYLLNPYRSKKYYCDATAQHNVLAHNCFDQIKQVERKFNICGLKSSYILDYRIHDLDKLRAHTIPSELSYACQHWATHLNASKDTGSLGTRLGEFLANHLLLWLEIMNLTGNISKTPAIANVAKQWATKHMILPETLHLAQAALRFVTTFATNPVSKSTPHIYISMLLSLPLDDPVRRSYAKQIQGGLWITGSALDRSLVQTAKCAMNGQVYSTAYAPDGTRIAVGAGNDVQVVDAFTGQPLIQPCKGHTWSVMSVAFSPEGSRIVSGSRDKTIRIWDSQTGELVGGPLMGHAGHIRSVAFSPGGACIVSGSNDKTIRVWNAQTGELMLGPLSGHTDYVKSIAIFSDDSQIISGSKDGTIRIWNLSTGDLALGPLKRHTDYITSVALSPDDSRIVTGSADRNIWVWDSHSGQTLLGPLVGHIDWVLSVTFTPDGTHIISGSSDRTICIWDAATGEFVAEPLYGHQSHVYSVSCSPIGLHFISGSGDETLCLWKARFLDTKRLETSPGHVEAVQSVHASPDGVHIVSGSADQTICVWDLTTKAVVLGPMTGHSGAVTSVCFSRNGNVIGSGSDDGIVRIWDGQTGVLIAELDPPHEPSRVNAVACSSYLIASASSDGVISVWSLASHERLKQLPHPHECSVESIDFSPDANRMVTGAIDGSICVMDVKYRRIQHRIDSAHSGPIRSVGYSPDGKTLISGSDDANIHVWIAETGQCLFQLKGHTAPVLSVRFSPNSLLVVSGSEDHTVRVWDPRRGMEILAPLRGHANSVNSVVFLPDGGLVVSASSDNVIRVWDIQPQSSVASGSGYIDWEMNQEGWIVDNESRHLAWLNPTLRASLMASRNIALFSQDGYIKLDFDGARIGESWTEIFQPA